MSINEEKYNFSGNVIRCTYKKDDFRIYAVSVDFKKYPSIKQNQYGNVSILGELPALTLGREYEFIALEQESKYGISYKVVNVKSEKIMSGKDMYVFLSEILTPNQAKTLYKVYPDIVERVKENRLEDIDFTKLKGIQEYTFEKIKQKIIENFCLSDLVVTFQGHLNLSIIKKLYDKYSSIEMLRKKLKTDPYKCLCEVSGVGFKTADSILLQIEKISKENVAKGKEPIISFDKNLIDSAERCLSCLLYLLEQNEIDGHTKINLFNLKKQCFSLVPECSKHFFDVLKSDKIYYSKDNMEIALKKTYDIECYIAENIVDGLRNKKNIWNYDIENYREVNGIKLSDEQIQAVSNICKYNISILNGAAGVGKSFCTQAIINLMIDNKKSFKLFSPTGKAAKVLSDYTKSTATTIHRGLGYNPKLGWYFNKENKLDCDIIIIDEFSMVGIHLFKRVIDAIDFNFTKLLIIGDDAQLCSVSCGNLLYDFIQSNLIPVTTLNKVFRYGEGGLMKIATDVRFGKPYLNNSMKGKATPFGQNKDYIFMDLPPEAIIENAVNIYRNLVNIGISIENIQVLTSKNTGDCGVDVLNSRLQQIANINYGSEDSMKIGETIYFKGDLIIQKENNYKAEIALEYMKQEECEYYKDKRGNPIAFVANGETGIIKGICKNYVIINFDDTYIKYYHKDMLKIGLGYAITIHKSQGSSIDNIILCTPKNHYFMLNSNLIYVGLTRMRKKCFHLGAVDSVNQSVKKKANMSRYTFMKNLLIKFNKQK